MLSKRRVEKDLSNAGLEPGVVSGLRSPVPPKPWQLREKRVLNGGCTVVVGAGSGTGAEIARRFAAEGYAVALARRDADALSRLAQEIGAVGGRAKTFGADASESVTGAAGCVGQGRFMSIATFRALVWRAKCRKSCSSG